MFRIGKPHHLFWVYLSEDIFLILSFFVVVVFDPLSYGRKPPVEGYIDDSVVCHVMDVMIWRTTPAQGYPAPISIFIFHWKNKL